MEKPDIILAFGFGTEGEPNRYIALYAKDCSRRYGVKVFTEEYVMPYLKDISGMGVVFFAEREGRHLSTFRIIDSFKNSAYVRRNHCKRVLLIAAPCHRGRCIRDLRKFGFEVIEDQSVMKSFRTMNWYNRDDPMFWVWNSFFWWWREIILRLLPWKIYSRIAA